MECINKKMLKYLQEAKSLFNGDTS
jgi:hypothetical protein